MMAAFDLAFFCANQLRIAKLHSNLHRKTLSTSTSAGKWQEKLKLARTCNAFITELDDNIATVSLNLSAESTLRPTSTGLSVSSLSGMPFAVKDNYCVTNVRTTCGSKMLANFMPAYTATVVRKLTDAGAILVGKTNMDEFAMGSGSVDSIFGPVRNPWNTECIAGGSSGGSAVAVAAGVVSFALGSDTGGSVRNPASYCGVVGFKPSYGTVSRNGLISLLNSTDVPSIFTKTVTLARTVFQAIAGWDPKDSATFQDPLPAQKQLSLQSLRVGIPREFHVTELGDTLDLYRDTAQRLEDAGAVIREISLPHSEYANACYTVLCACDVASNMARFDGVEFGHRSATPVTGSDALYAATRHEGLNEVVRGRILAGNYFLLKRNYRDYFLQAARVRRLIADDYGKVFENDVDVILTPVTFGGAPEMREFCELDNRTQQEMQDLFTVGASLAGLPAISVPVVRRTASSMPVGMQLIAPFRQDLFLLDVAMELERILTPVES